MNGKQILGFCKGKVASGLRVTGSHYWMAKGDLKTTVPVHGTQDVHPRTVKSIEKDTRVKLR